MPFKNIKLAGKIEPEKIDMYQPSQLRLRENERSHEISHTYLLQEVSALGGFSIKFGEERASGCDPGLVRV